MNTIIETTAPIKKEDLKRYFDDNTIMYSINYKDSAIKGKILLTYLANLNIPCDLDYTGTTKEELFELLSAYFNTTTINQIPSLALLASHVMLVRVNADVGLYYDETPFADQEISEFIEANQESVDRWKLFLDSTMLFLIYKVYKPTRDENALSQYETIDDTTYVGLNVTQLIILPKFLEVYTPYSDMTRMCYFKSQFNTAMFRNQCLFDFYIHENSTFLSTFVNTMEGNLPTTEEELNQMFEEAIHE